MKVYNQIKQRVIYTQGSKYVSSIEGLGAIIFILLVLKEKSIKNKQTKLKKWATNQGTSIYQKEFRIGQKFSLEELVEEVIQTQHPSAIFELADSLYGGGKEAFKEMNTIRKKCELAEETAFNVTGRYRVKEQQTYNLDDLIKVGSYFKDIQHMLPILLDKQGRQYRGIMFGEAGANALIFNGDLISVMMNMPSKDVLLNIFEKGLGEKIGSL